MTDHITAFRTRLPAGGPSWLIDYDRSITGLFRLMMPGPFTLHGYDTANLPSASVHTHSVVYDHDADTIKFSDGANWLTYSLSTHVHAAADVTNTPAGTIAAANVQAALNELDTEKLAASSYTAADVLSKLLTVDGAGSGLDADLLDGNSSAAFALAVHTHSISDVTGLQAALDAKLDDSQATAYGLSLLGSADAAAAKTLLALVKADVGLGNVDNTSDANKPVSTAQQAALDAKLDDSQATAFGLSLLDDANAAAGRSTLGLVIGTDVQAWDADLDTIAANNTAAGRAMVAAADAAAQRVLLRSGALVRKSVDETAANYTTAPAVTWDQEAYDDAGYHDNSTNPSRLTIPADGRYRVGANIALSLVNASVRVLITITKGGVGTFDGAAAMESTTPGTNPRISVTTGPVACTAGEYFEVSLFVQTDTSITVLATSSNFWIEAC